MNLVVEWVDESDDAQFAQDVLGQLDQRSKKAGLYYPFIYINDAGMGENPFALYGNGTSLPRMRTTRQRYDPTGGISRGTCREDNTPALCLLLHDPEAQLDDVEDRLEVQRPGRAPRADPRHRPGPRPAGGMARFPISRHWQRPCPCDRFPSNVLLSSVQTVTLHLLYTKSEGTDAAFGGFRSRMNTLLPCLARILAAAYPIPDDPPAQGQHTLLILE